MNEKKLINNIEKLFKNSLTSIDKLDESIFNFYYTKYKYLNNELIEHRTNEPIKFFKRRYNEWLKKLKELEIEKKEVLNKLKDFYKDIQ